jgi:hypothetical protein
LQGVTLVRCLLAFILFVLLSSPSVYAAGRSPDYPTGFDHPPSNDEIKTRLQDICVNVSADKARAQRRCGCYVSGVMKKLTADELEALRTTGHFAESAQPKVRALMASCKVQIDHQ